MRVAVPTEIKNNENRVAMTPAGVDALVHRGHEVLVQAGAVRAVGSRTTSTAWRVPRSSRRPTRPGRARSSWSR